MLNQPLDENIGIAVDNSKQSEKKETNPTAAMSNDFNWCFLLNCCFLLVV
jgi:hypothetical protein